MMLLLRDTASKYIYSHICAIDLIRSIAEISSIIEHKMVEKIIFIMMIILLNEYLLE